MKAREEAEILSTIKIEMGGEKNMRANKGSVKENVVV